MSEGLDEPTKGEIVRRLDRIDEAQQQILLELKHDREAVAKTYMRQDVYIAERQLHNAFVSDIQTDIALLRKDHEDDIKSILDDRKADVQWRRQVLLWLGGITVTLLLGIAGLIVTLVR